MAAACGAGVPAAGVLGLESDAFSADEFGAAGSVVDVAGDSLASLIGESSLTKSGSMMALRFCGVVLKVTTSLVLEGLPVMAAVVAVVAVAAAAAAVFDFRRSLDAAVCLLAGGMIKGR